MKSRIKGTFDRIRCHSRIIGLCLLLAFTPALKGCYGNFPLTKAVYNFNGDVSESRWIRSIVMWVFIIIPVYGVSMFADAIVFNLIEFWTGEPMEFHSTQTSDGTRMTIAPSADQQEATLTITKPNGDEQVMRFVKTSDTAFDVIDQNNHVAGHVLRQSDGSIVLTDANYAVVQVLDNETIRAAKSAVR